MQSREWSLAFFVGLSVLCMCSLATAESPSFDEPLNHEELNIEQSNTDATTPASVARLTEQLRALEAKVNALESAAESESESESDVDAATASRLTAIERLINNTSIRGRMYADFTYLNHIDSLTGKSDKTGTGLDVKRFYFGVVHRFDDTWSVALTTDITYSSATEAVTPYIKKAYIEAKFAQEAVLRIGAADTPWVPFAEDQYGYRYLEKTIADREAFATSADWGVHMSGDIGESKRFNYAVSVVTGHGYRDPTRSKGMDIEARIGVVPVKGMMIAVGGYIGFRGHNLQNADVQRTAQRLNLLVAYVHERFRVGGEYFATSDWNTVSGPETSSAYGISLWGGVNLPARFALFGRYDRSALSGLIGSSAIEQYYNAGVEYTIRDGMNFALVYKREHHRLSLDHGVKTDEVGVFVQAKF